MRLLYTSRLRCYFDYSSWTYSRHVLTHRGRLYEPRLPCFHSCSLNLKRQLCYTAALMCACRGTSQALTEEQLCRAVKRLHTSSTDSLAVTGNTGSQVCASAHQEVAPGAT